MATSAPSTGQVKTPFFTYRYHSRSEAFGSPKFLGILGGLRGIAQAYQPPEKLMSDEDTARYHLARLFGQETHTPLRALLADERPQVLPDLKMHDIMDLARTNTKLVRFRQAHKAVPIFGSNVVVEIEPGGEFVSVTAKLTEPPKAPTMPKISASEALREIAKYGNRNLADLEKEVVPPVNRLFHRRDTGEWHLTYLFSRVPVAPLEVLAELNGYAPPEGPRGVGRRAATVAYNYFVDATNGQMVFYYSADPQLASMKKALPPPTMLNGLDEEGQMQSLDGTFLGAEFEMHDPLRDVKTYDNHFAEANPKSLPATPLRSPSATIGSAAAVSAHTNATLVWRFYNDVLNRRGIDGNGMVLESVVNCTDPRRMQAPPEWDNATWWEGRMWYGQKRDGGGNFKSYARYLDIIAHELTHGVTERIAGLEYKNESGALDESLSDIFGVIISNHALRGRSSIAGWNWEIGPGLGMSGGPLRDFSSPARTSDPEHMKDYKRTSRDSGGVHTNSGIHNKAAYHLMTTVDPGGSAAFPPEEVALLYHYGTMRLGAEDGFASMRDALEDVVTSRYAGQPMLQQQRITQIHDAYQKVGIV